MDSIRIYVDGGCRNNGGESPEAYGSMAVKYRGEIKRRESWQFNNATTNNMAEYGAVFAAMQYVSLLKDRANSPLPEIEILSDSRLVVSQLSNGWKVKAENLVDLHARAIKWLGENPSVIVKKIPRADIMDILGH